MKTLNDFENYLNKIKEMAAKEGYDSLDDTYVRHLKARYFNEPVVIGETDRVVLRELKILDLDGIYTFEDAAKEPVLSSFIKETRAVSKEHLESYIQNMYPLYDYGIWAVVRKSTGKIIGLCGLGQTEVNGEMCTDLGYYICPKCRNMGFAKECIEIVLDYAKNYLEFTRIYAIIKEENRISQGILREFAFEYQNRYKEHMVYQKILME
jgi:RimJ/RimL family protein N-acetyltransferase